MTANAPGSGFTMYPDPGLCRDCLHSRRLAHPHGGYPYWRCGMSDRDKGYAKYPRLPVRECAGFVHSVTDSPLVSKVDGDQERGSG